MCSYSSKSQSKTNTFPCCFDWHKYLWCPELHTNTNAFLVGNTVPSFCILCNHKAIRLACAWGTEIIFGVLTGTRDAGLVNGNEAVWKISLLVSWQLQCRLAGPLPVSLQRPFQRKLRVPRRTVLYPRGSTLLGLSAGLWEDGLRTTCPQEHGSKFTGKPILIRKMSTLPPLISNS